MLFEHTTDRIAPCFEAFMDGSGKAADDEDGLRSDVGATRCPAPENGASMEQRVALPDAQIVRRGSRRHTVAPLVRVDRLAYQLLEESGDRATGAGKRRLECRCVAHDPH